MMPEATIVSREMLIMIIRDITDNPAILTMIPKVIIVSRVIHTMMVEAMIGRNKICF